MLVPTGTYFVQFQIQKAIGMVRTNGAKLDSRPGHAGGTAVYPNYSMINHNCVCNVRTM